VTDEYLEMYAFAGLPYLDPASWRHYLPYLIEYSLCHPRSGSMVLDGLLYSLRPPDRVPPRLGSLEVDQESVVVAFLERIGFEEPALPEQNLALQVTEEWWIPGALYREARGEGRNASRPA